MRLFVLTLLCCGLLSCTGLPERVTPINQFQLSKYLGTWHEVARLDHAFERGLTKVKAEYSLRDDGGVRVINRGFNTDDQTWQQAEGRAYFMTEPNVGHLKVSFFGPFYGSYVIYQLDADYQFAFVSGYSTEYLWLLSRTPTVTQEVKDTFIKGAKERGFDVDSLIWL